jgi:hypothetical protein
MMLTREHAKNGEDGMAKFLFVYHGGGAPSSPEEGQKVMAAWGAWMQGIGSGLVDGGAAVGKSSTVKADGSVAGDGGANPVSGYSLIEAPDLAAAQKVAKGCPILQAGGSVEIAPTMEM